MNRGTRCSPSMERARPARQLRPPLVCRSLDEGLGGEERGRMLPAPPSGPRSWVLQPAPHPRTRPATDRKRRLPAVVGRGARRGMCWSDEYGDGGGGGGGVGVPRRAISHRVPPSSPRLPLPSHSPHTAHSSHSSQLHTARGRRRPHTTEYDDVYDSPNDYPHSMDDRREAPRTAFQPSVMDSRGDTFPWPDSRGHDNGRSSIRRRDRDNREAPRTAFQPSVMDSRGDTFPWPDSRGHDNGRSSIRRRDREDPYSPPDVHDYALRMEVCSSSGSSNGNSPLSAFSSVSERSSCISSRARVDPCSPPEIHDLVLGVELGSSHSKGESPKKSDVSSVSDVDIRQLGCPQPVAIGSTSSVRLYAAVEWMSVTRTSVVDTASSQYTASASGESEDSDVLALARCLLGGSLGGLFPSSTSTSFEPTSSQPTLSERKTAEPTAPQRKSSELTSSDLTSSDVTSSEPASSCDARLALLRDLVASLAPPARGAGGSDGGSDPGDRLSKSQRHLSSSDSDTISLTSSKSPPSDSDSQQPSTVKGGSSSSGSTSDTSPSPKTKKGKTGISSGATRTASRRNRRPSARSSSSSSVSSSSSSSCCDIFSSSSEISSSSSSDTRIAKSPRKRLPPTPSTTTTDTASTTSQSATELLRRSSSPVPRPPPPPSPVDDSRENGHGRLYSSRHLHDHYYYYNSFSFTETSVSTCDCSVVEDRSRARDRYYRHLDPPEDRRLRARSPDRVPPCPYSHSPCAQSAPPAENAAGQKQGVVDTHPAPPPPSSSSFPLCRQPQPYAMKPTTTTTTTTNINDKDQPRCVHDNRCSAGPKPCKAPGVTNPCTTPTAFPATRPQPLLAPCVVPRPPASPQYPGLVIIQQPCSSSADQSGDIEPAPPISIQAASNSSAAGLFGTKVGCCCAITKDI